MAVVGHAYVVVRAITDGVANDIARGFSGSKIGVASERAGRGIGNALIRGITAGVQDDKNVFTKTANNFQRLYPEADGLRRAFTGAMRAGYTLQSGLGALISTLAAAGGGLIALGGAAAGASASIVAAAGAVVALRVGLGVVSFSLKGISQAVKQATTATGGYREELQKLRFEQDEAALSEDRAALNLEKARQNMLRVADLAPSSLIRRDATLAFREAELAYRRAKDRAEDLKDGLETPGGGGQDPFAGLTPSQKDFAEYLVSIKGKLDELREAAAKGFLPILQEQIQRIIDSPLPGILKQRFEDIAGAAGEALTKFVDITLEAENLRDLDEVLGNIAENLPSVGTIAGNMFDGFLTLLAESDGQTKRFLKFLEDKSGEFAKFLDTKQATGELETFFTRAGDIAASLGTTFGNVFEGIGRVIKVNFEPGSGGDTILQWLEKVSEGFANKDIIGAELFFQRVADNFIIVAETLGGALETLGKTAGDPAVGEFWKNLDNGSLAFQTLVQESVKAQVPLGNLVENLGQIMSIFADSGQPMAFFDTLSFIAGGFEEIFRQMKPFLDAVGPVIGAISAVGLLIGIVTKLALVFGGFVKSALVGLGLVTTAINGTTTATIISTAATQGFTAAIKTAMLSNPIGWALLAVTAIAGVAAAIAGIDAKKLDDTSKNLTTAFKSGEDGMSVWKTAVRGMNDEGMVKLLDSSKEVKEALQGTTKETGRFGQYATRNNQAVTRSFEAVGRSLGNIASTDLPTAQEGFQKLTKELGLNKDETKQAFDKMKDFQTALVDQADQLGINVRKMDGTIDKQKLLDLALGEGEIAIRKHNEELKKQKEALEAVIEKQAESSKKWEEQTLKIGGWNDAIKKGLKDGKGTLEDVLKEMEIGLQTSIETQEGYLKVKMRGLGEAGLQMIEDAGEDAPALIEMLIGATDAEFKKFDDLANKAALRLSDTFNRAKTDLINAWADGKISTATFNALNGGLQKASNPQELAAIKTRIQQALNDPIRIRTDLDMSAAKETLNRFQQSGVSLTAFIRADGGMGQRRAYGGYISGPGGSRSDLIPAMLSNGEYVVNARSTARYRNLLERINAEGNKFADGGAADGSRGVPLGGNINIVVNPSPGMDEKALAAAVSRRLAFEIKKGTI